MYGEENNLKDIKNTAENSSLFISDAEFSLSYKKTNKLVTALFMVTDIMDKDEPVRIKLRTLGVEILSDTTSLARPVFNSKTVLNLNDKVQETLHFLDMAETVNLVSRMNSSILKKEFVELKNSLEDYIDKTHSFGGKATLSEFFKAEEKFSITPAIQHERSSIGHVNPTRIGVQKGSTLMKALSDKILARGPKDMSFKSDKEVSVRNNYPAISKNSNFKPRENFDLLKKQRREEITKVIKNSANPTEGTSITDIRNSLEGSLLSSSEKTLQRELVSMVTDGVLKKTGSKRWSRYFLS